MTTPHLPPRRLLAAVLLPLLAGCSKTVVLNAPGDVAAQQGNLIIIATVLMLLIIVPVIVLTLLFAWRYRASNTEATYRPDWDHSTQLELVIWAAPLLIIIALGAVTWISTHLLDPYRPLGRLAPGKAIPADAKPLDVEVVAMDWKWLFFYPEQGIATVNEMAAPVDRPVRFRITASSVMNAFSVPALAGMIYAMPGMETQLQAVMNKPGDYEGMSTNYSGAGFSHMRFRFRALDQAGFDSWVREVRGDGGRLDRDGYLQLEKPSIADPVRHYGDVDPSLYHAVLNRCVAPGQPCLDETMHHDLGDLGNGTGQASASPAHAMPMPMSPAPAAADPAATEHPAHAHGQ